MVGEVQQGMLNAVQGQMDGLKDNGNPQDQQKFGQLQNRFEQLQNQRLGLASNDGNNTNTKDKNSSANPPNIPKIGMGILDGIKSSLQGLLSFIFSGGASNQQMYPKYASGAGQAQSLAAQAISMAGVSDEIMAPAIQLARSATEVAGQLSAEAEQTYTAYKDDLDKTKRDKSYNPA